MPESNGFKINKAGAAELRLDEKHTLIVHKTDEGVVLDVWEDGGREAVWSTYHFTSEMLPEED